MGDSPERSRVDEGAWTQLEQGFFASAPPDVPEPPPEPARFDDMEPIAPPRPERSANFGRALAAAVATRASIGRRVVAAGRRALPVWARIRGRTASGFAATARGFAAAGRTVSSALRAARVTAERTARSGAIRLVAALAVVRLDRRGVGIALASVIVVTGFSVGVVASRNGAGARSMPAAVEAPVVVVAPAAAPPASPGSTAVVAGAPAIANAAIANAVIANAAIANAVIANAVIANAEPAAPAPVPATPEPSLRPPTESEPPHAEAPKRPSHHHRKLAAAPSSQRDLMIPAFMASTSQPAVRPAPAPVPARRPFFSR